jgi:hypothetical protein
VDAIVRTLNVYTVDELVERWKRRAMNLEDDPAGHSPYEYGYANGQAQAYRCAAAELMAILAASMEMEAAHHGDPEPDESGCRIGRPACLGNVRCGEDTPCFLRRAADANALMEWSQGLRP